jgi:hypothetical protein
MPFARKAIDASAIRRVARSHELPKYEEGYEEWHGAFLQKRGEIYTIRVKDAVSVSEHTWRAGIGCDASQERRCESFAASREDRWRHLLGAETMDPAVGRDGLVEKGRERLGPRL